MACTLPNYSVGLTAILYAPSFGLLAAKFKWYDKRSRSDNEFLLDSSKQLLGVIWLLMCNMLCEKLIGDNRFESCEWYWINTMLDTTLGVLIEYIALQAIMWVLQHVAIEYTTSAHDYSYGYTRNASVDSRNFRTGEYKDASDEISPWQYAKQLAVWLLCVTCMKLTLSMVTYVFHAFFENITHRFSDFVGGGETELFDAIILFPCIMNTFQFMVTDKFLKKPSEADSLGEYVIPLTTANANSEGGFPAAPNKPQRPEQLEAAAVHMLQYSNDKRYDFAQGNFYTEANAGYDLPPGGAQDFHVGHQPAVHVQPGNVHQVGVANIQPGSSPAMVSPHAMPQPSQISGDVVVHHAAAHIQPGNVHQVGVANVQPGNSPAMVSPHAMPQPLQNSGEVVVHHAAAHIQPGNVHVPQLAPATPPAQPQPGLFPHVIHGNTNPGLVHQVPTVGAVPHHVSPPAIASPHFQPSFPHVVHANPQHLQLHHAMREGKPS